MKKTDLPNGTKVKFKLHPLSDLYRNRGIKETEGVIVEKTMNGRRKSWYRVKADMNGKTYSAGSTSLEVL